MAVARATVSAHRMVMLTQRGPPTFSMLQAKTAARTVRTEPLHVTSVLMGFIYVYIYLILFIYLYIIYIYIQRT